MSEETKTEEMPAPQTPKAKKARAAKPKAKKPAKAAKKKGASRASSKPASARPKKRGKVPGHWSDTHAQFVVHAHPSLVAKFGRSLARLLKRFKLEGRATRGLILRTLVERAVK